MLDSPPVGLFSLSENNTFVPSSSPPSLFPPPSPLFSTISYSTWTPNYLSFSLLFFCDLIGQVLHPIYLFSFLSSFFALLPPGLNLSVCITLENSTATPGHHSLLPHFPTLSFQVPIPNEEEASLPSLSVPFPLHGLFFPFPLLSPSFS